MSVQSTTAQAAHLPAPTIAPVLELTERDARVLDFERRWWQFAGAKEDAMREQFGLNATEYYQVLNALLDTEAALAYDAMLVKRLRRMRSARQRSRGSRHWELTGSR